MATRTPFLAGAAIAVCAALLTTGCTTTVKPVRPEVAGELTELDRGYATLAALLGDERKVHQILPLKSEGLPVRLITQEIAVASAKADDELKALALLQPPLNLEQPPNLPMIEQATRDSIAMETTLDLLFSTDTFETRLMVCQTQALRYGRFLALKLKEADPNDERQAWLAALAKEYERLYSAIVEELQPPKPETTGASAATPE